MYTELKHRIVDTKRCSWKTRIILLDMLLILFQRYTGACSRLLVQYKAAFKQVEGGEYPTVESFMKKNKVSFPEISKD